MKVPLPKIFVSFLVFIFFSQTTVLALTEDEAVRIAQETSEADAFYGLLSREHEGCIEAEVLASCESDWVTCIDDGWVVRFKAKDACGLKNDGRLSLTFVLDQDGQVISRFPEVEYFQSPRYCLEDYDCLYREGACVNFIAAPLMRNFYGSRQSCLCSDGECQKAP